MIDKSSWPEKMRQLIHQDQLIIEELGIDNEQDKIKLFLLITYVPQVVKDIFKRNFSQKIINKIVKYIFKNKSQISTLPELMMSVKESINHIIPEESRPKLAYPTGTGYPNQRPIYNISKWVKSTEEVYQLMNKGYSEQQARQMTVGAWDEREFMDYTQWLKYFKERVPEKYKMATIYDNPIPYASPDVPGYVIPVDSMKAKFPMQQSMPNLPGRPSDVNDARDRIEKQRSKLVARLNSAEKLLSTLDGQIFAGDDLELILKLLHDLKRRIQTSNKFTVKSTLFEDYIYRTANHLTVQGKRQAADFFYKIAQVPEPDFSAQPPTPEANVAAPNKDTEEFLREFFSNLKRGLDDPKADERRSELKQKKAQVQTPIVEPAPPPMTVATKPSSPKEEEGDIDSVIETALNNVTTEDAVRQLEILVGFYNKRERSRKLALLDLMLDKLGLGTFFPALGEAQNKELEASQYIVSRLEGVLSKLKSSAEPDDEVIEVSDESHPETQAIQQKLIDQEKKEEETKQLRKQKELAPKAEPIPELKEPGNIEKASPINTR